MDGVRWSVRRVRSWVGAGPVLLAACSPTGPDCSTVDPFPYGILVTAVDDALGVTLRSDVTGETVGGDRTRDMIVLPDGVLAATVPHGTYDVRVEAPGFVAWDTTGITTERGICSGFVPVELEARLDPA